MKAEASRTRSKKHYAGSSPRGRLRAVEHSVDVARSIGYSDEELALAGDAISARLWQSAGAERAQTGHDCAGSRLWRRARRLPCMPRVGRQAV